MTSTDDETQREKRRRVSKVYYICGQYYPKPKPSEEITIENAHRDVPAHELERLNSTMVGKPITIDHPIGGDGVALPSDEWKSTVRGKCVWTGRLRDGGYYFVGEMPLVQGNAKTYMTQAAIERGELRGVSLGNQCSMMFNNNNDSQYYATYKSDHIALLNDGAQEHKSCKVFNTTKPMAPLAVDTTDAFNTKERYREVSNAFNRIFRENSTRNSQLQSDTSTHAKTREHSDNREPQQTNDETTSPYRSYSSTRMNFVDMPTSTTQPSSAATTQAQKQQQQQQQPSPNQSAATSQPMSDDNNARKDGECNSCSAEQSNSDAAATSDTNYNHLSNMTQEELIWHVGELAEKYADLQNRTGEIMQSAIEDKERSLYEKLNKIGAQMYHMRISQIDDDELTDENKEKIAKEVKKFINQHYKIPDEKRKNADSFSQELQRKLLDAESWGNQFDVMQNSSAEGSERVRRALLSTRRNARETRHHDILRGGVRGGYNMKPNASTSQSPVSSEGVRREMMGTGGGGGNGNWSASTSSTAPIPTNPQDRDTVIADNVIRRFQEQTGHSFRRAPLSTERAQELERKALEFTKAQRMANANSSLLSTSRF